MKKLFYYKRNRKDKSIVGIISQHKSTTDTKTNLKTRERERKLGEYNQTHRIIKKTPAALRTESAAPQSQSVYEQCTEGP